MTHKSTGTSTCEIPTCACERGGPWRPCVDGLVCLGCFGRAGEALYGHFCQSESGLALRRKGGLELYGMQELLNKLKAM